MVLDAGFNLYIYIYILLLFCVFTKCILPWCNCHGWLDAKKQLSVYLLMENCVCLVFCCSDDSLPDEDYAWWKIVSAGFFVVQMTHNLMKTVHDEKLSVGWLLFRWLMTWWRLCSMKNFCFFVIQMTHDLMKTMHDQEETQQTKFSIGQLYIVDRGVWHFVICSV